MNQHGADCNSVFDFTGIGYFHLNVRFNCRPEITVFEI